MTDPIGLAADLLLLLLRLLLLPYTVFCHYFWWWWRHSSRLRPQSLLCFALGSVLDSLCLCECVCHAADADADSVAFLTACVQHTHKRFFETPLKVQRFSTVVFCLAF